MLQELPTSSLREESSVVLETARLVLRQPTLADVKAIACLVNDRRVAENLRRVPHPYTADDAIAFISHVAATDRDTVFLIEHKGRPVGMVGLDWSQPETPELGYWLGVDHWRQGIATEAARAVIDYAFEEFAIEQVIAGARVVNPASRHILEKCGFQWTGVELHRFLALGSSTPVDRFRLDRSVWASLKSWSIATRR
ncbi:GNAT family N-acetyltransferase [Bradyrhizobium sp. U87765 SZCCT0131]|uniref:GNAT family N-acetyltransferase n=1 Tax=unclassified Bradyrhizobium TaxID=2631580 RepID=UPI001BA60AB8|nr:MULTISPECIES: GNAT family N-acetyltransferase [unclassified Bradyrhizobium]MBR1216421.1 GNAT family N-acetyltransferase [Bradyrhizobium sp. U87765 SZCCT0131]MBR1259830.1 GNAT family N-acetyltransferase [Bradyrhizobium sp. U87765 SZCCT0134]MBR1305964.1 GNAT family N-acetyltransferase [Bradyrhizobium sp. U87765 SZCCT0110]MBR1322331.1 GNAT family N-acetyltransferase [Bradyrhizobium sp. U87765 SZCCT0109]MBR1352379.1 GNAT family N-acetyltransferase [Bradyrhizobium sp. U87765 SZCCT0048]